jgi:AcrR family transcriptional regulator
VAATRAKAERPNQKHRTRKDLLQAAARLMKQNQKPSLEEIAAEALVSRATAYRYFPNLQSLLVEASLDVAFPDAAEVFQGASNKDPVLRLEQVDDALDEVIRDNEAALRTMLAYSLAYAAETTASGNLPARQNRRTPLIDEALRPAREQFKPATLKLLSSALAIMLGTEAMVVCKDVLQLDDVQARKVKRWAIRALVDAARRPALGR